MFRNRAEDPTRAETRRHEPGEAAWRRLEPLPPPGRRRRGGGPPVDRRRTIDGIPRVPGTGCSPWRDLPGRCGPWSSVADALYRWREAGVRDHAPAGPQRDADARGRRLDRASRHADGTIVRAHQHAAGARRTGAAGGWGRGAGPLARRLLDQGPRPPRPRGPAAVLPPHRRGAADHEAVPSLPDRRTVRRAGPGRPRRRPERPVGDGAYSERHVRDEPRRRRIGAVVPRPRFPLEAAACRERNAVERNAVERLTGRLERFRRVAARYERRAANCSAMLQIAATLLWLRG